MALDLPYNARGEVLPTELDQQFLDSLDQALARQETQQIQRIGSSQEGRGFLQSGNTLKQVAEQVIGPGLERRQQALLPLAMQSAQMGREERLQGVQFGQQKELLGQQFNQQKQLQFEAAQQRLQEIDRQAQIQRDLMSLQDELQGGGLGQLLGGIAGIGLGSLFGGMGAGLGQRAGASLFGGGGGGGTGGGMGRLDLQNSNRFPFYGQEFMR